MPFTQHHEQGCFSVILFLGGKYLVGLLSFILMFKMFFNYVFFLDFRKGNLSLVATNLN